MTARRARWAKAGHVIRSLAVDFVARLRFGPAPWSVVVPSVCALETGDLWHVHLVSWISLCAVERYPRWSEREASIARWSLTRVSCDEPRRTHVRCQCAVRARSNTAPTPDATHKRRRDLNFTLLAECRNARPRRAENDSLSRPRRAENDSLSISPSLPPLSQTNISRILISSLHGSSPIVSSSRSHRAAPGPSPAWSCTD